MIVIPSKLMFDFDIESQVKKLLDYATKDSPDCQWVITAIFWSDGDYRIRVQTAFGGKIQYYTYKKSENVYRKELVRCLSVEANEVLDEQKITVGDQKDE